MPGEFGHIYPSINISGSAHVHLGDVVQPYADPTGQEAQQQCHRAFKTSNYEQHKNVYATRAPNTCNWVLRHHQFARWKDSNHNDLLWISADPGCGKSVLSRFLAESWQPEEDSSTICYFFFRDNDEQSSLASMLCAILHQLFASRPNLIAPYAIPPWSRTGEHLVRETAQMWRMLQAAAADTNPLMGPVICVVDALDECAEDDRCKLIKLLCQFYLEATRSQSQSKAILKFIVTSRPYDDVQRCFHDITDSFPQIRLRGEDENDSINKEINLVIHDSVRGLVKELGLSEGTQERLLDTLLQMEHRTYLWLYLAIAHIRQDFYNSVHPEAVQIKSLPTSVEDAYEQILSRISSGQREIVLRILLIIVGARRPLTTDQIATALAVSTMQTDELPANFVPIAKRHIESRIRQWCGLFVFINHSKVYLIHQTAKEFLTMKSTTSSQHTARWKGSLSFTDCEKAMAHLTIQYLCLDRFDIVLEVARRSHQTLVVPRIGVEESEEFFIYCANNWASHLRASHLAEGEILLKQALALCQTTPELHPWFLLHLFKGYDGHKQVTRGILRQHVAAFVGYVPLLDLLFTEEQFAVDAVDGEGRTPLNWAVLYGHEQAVNWLLSKGARVDAWAQESGEVYLTLAIQHGYKRLAQYLVAAGVSITIGDETSISKIDLRTSDFERFLADSNSSIRVVTPALHVAVRHKQDRLVSMLMNYSASVDAKDGEGRTALHLAASTGGSRHIANLLLEGGAGVDLQDSLGETALFLATLQADANLVNMLLNRSANPDIPIHDGRTALSYACQYGPDSLIQQLLLGGANPNVNAPSGGSEASLHGATHRNRIMVVKMLLDNGADIDLQSGPLGDTALTIASRCGYQAMVGLLLSRHAKVNLARFPGDRALDLALYSSQGQPTPIVAMLLNKGALPRTQRGRDSLATLIRRYQQRQLRSRPVVRTGRIR